MTLQFLGIYAVVRELKGAQEHFRRLGPVAWTDDWWKRWPRAGDAILLSSEITIGVSASATGRVRVSPGADSTVEQRLASLEKNVGYIDTELAQSQAAISHETSERTAALRDETAARQAEDRRISQQLEQVSTGSISFSYFGVLWLAMGVLVATASPEIFRWFSLCQ